AGAEVRRGRAQAEGAVAVRRSETARAGRVTGTLRVPSARRASVSSRDTLCIRARQHRTSNERHIRCWTFDVRCSQQKLDREITLVSFPHGWTSPTHRIHATIAADGTRSVPATLGPPLPPPPHCCLVALRLRADLSARGRVAAPAAGVRAAVAQPRGRGP